MKFGGVIDLDGGRPTGGEEKVVNIAIYLPGLVFPWADGQRMLRLAIEKRKH